MGRGGENNSTALSHNDFLIISSTGNTAHLSSDGYVRLCVSWEPPPEQPSSHTQKVLVLFSVSARRKFKASCHKSVE